MMSKLSLIPFGLKLPEQYLVDVSEVDRGRNCNCICPSCKTTLIARQGTKYEWHFAHATKGAQSDTETVCKYSFWVSVFLMAKQVLKQTKNITLPSLTMYSNDAAKYEVAKKTSVTCNDLRIDAAIHSTTFDAVFNLGEYTIGLSFTAPHRSVNRSHEIVINDKIGILEVSLNDAMKWFYGNNNKGNYTKLLKENIIDKVECKEWICHPRQIAIEEKYNVSLSKQCIVTPEKTLDRPEKYFVDWNSHAETSEMYGNCVICGNNLSSTGACPVCKNNFTINE